MFESCHKPRSCVQWHGQHLPDADTAPGTMSVLPLAIAEQRRSPMTLPLARAVT